MWSYYGWYVDLIWNLNSGFGKQIVEFCVSMMYNVLEHRQWGRDDIMSQDRTAVDTITGYYYQFNYYTLKLLSLENLDDTVCIEAIEDVDIHAQGKITAVQCKYYAKTEYNHSVIAPAIRLMLSHFKENPSTRNTLTYKLYGHFETGQRKLSSNSISIEFLKNKFLSYTKDGVKHKHHIELGLSDAELQQFVNHLYVDVNAAEFSTQEKEIITTLKSMFHCNLFEAEYYYYNNTLRVIKQLATEQDITKRSISKRNFLSAINQKQPLFESWYIEYRGLVEYCRAIKQEYFSQVNISPYARFFLIECDGRISVQQIKSLLLKISKNWSKLSKNEVRPFCPYVYLHGISEPEIIDIKRALQNDGIYFVDGYDFKGAGFSPKSIVRKPSAHNEIKLKFITEIHQIADVLNSISTTRIIYQFYLETPFYENNHYEVHAIKIQETQNIEKMI